MFFNIEHGTELIVRKKLAQFIEKYFRYLGYDFRHTLFKQIVYMETPIQTQLEQTLKNSYDAYFYLLSNNQNIFSSSLLKKFFYILKEEEPTADLITRLTDLFFKTCVENSLENSIIFSHKTFKTMVELDTEYRFLISLIFLNFSLVKVGIPTLVFNETILKELSELYSLNVSNNLVSYISKFILESKKQDRSYYQNLKKLTFKEIYNTLLDDKVLLTQFGVKHLYIFGSFAQGAERLDSDIDLLAEFSLDITKENKQKNKDTLKQLYFEKFKRFVDLIEVGPYLSENLLKEINNCTKVF